MCELFGLSADTPERATKSLPVFANTYARWNPDGWGLAFYQDSKVKVIRRPFPATSDATFFEQVREAKSKIIIAHLRFATQGEPCMENCHPFHLRCFGRDWIFAHNGNISSCAPHPRSVGTTDSENIFHFIMDSIQKYIGDSVTRGMYPGIKNGIKKTFECYGREIDLNFLMSDGQILYIFNHYEGKPIFYLKREKEHGNVFLVSTQRLNDDAWGKIPKDKLLLLSGGQSLVLSDRL